MAEVVEVDDLSKLCQYRLAWDVLHAETPRASFFQTYDWFTTYWRHFGHGQRMRVLIVLAAGRPVGITPLCIRHRPHRLGGVDVLTYPVDDWTTFYGPVGAAQSATLLMALRHVVTTPRDWQAVDLVGVARDSTDGRRTEKAMQHVGATPRSEPYAISSLIETANDWDDYLATRSRKVRHEMRRTLRRTAEWGEVEFVRHRPAARRAGDGDPRWDLYDMCEQVASESWQAASPVGNTLCDPRFAGFYRDCHAAASRLGMLDMAVLKLAGRPVAFWYGYHFQGRVIGLRTGFSALAPIGGLGTTLLANLIRDSFERHDLSIDFGGGNQKYKQRIRTHTETSYRVTHTPVVCWRPHLIRAGHWLRDQIAAG